MPIWVWIVILIIVGLVVYEVSARVRGQAIDSGEQQGYTLKPNEDPEAALARAHIKLAILESRLQQSSEVIGEEKRVIEEKYRQKLGRLEAAYQKQMAVLGTKLSQTERQMAAVQAEAQPRKPEYEVRLAADVSAWLTGTEAPDKAPQRIAEDAQVDLPTEASLPEVDEGMDLAALPAGDVVSEPLLLAAQAESAVLNADDVALIAEGEEGQELTEAITLGAATYEAQVAFDANREDDFAGDEALAESIYILDDDAIDKASGADRDADVKDAIKLAEEAHNGPDLRYHRDNGESPAEMQIEPAEIVQEAIEGNSSEHGGASDSASEEPAVFPGVAWTERHERALQRALARQLGSEMDADYLEDDEFMREMGFDPAMAGLEALSAKQLEDIMSSNDWIMDPIQVLANHLAGMEPAQRKPDAETESTTDEQMVFDDPWEAMVFADAAAKREQKAESEAGDNDDRAADSIQPQVGTGDSDREDEAEAAEIEALVAAIMARAPAQTDEINSPTENSQAEQQSEFDEHLAETAEVRSEAAPSSISDGTQQEEAAKQTAEPIQRDAAVSPSLQVQHDPSELDADRMLKDKSANTSPGKVQAHAESAAKQGPPVVPPDSGALEAALAQAKERERQVNRKTPNGNGKPMNGTNGHANRQGNGNGNDYGIVSQMPSFDWQREPIVWNGEYYDNTQLSDSPVVVRQDRDIDFEWYDRPPAQGVQPRVFSVRWSGAIPLEQGCYRFEATAPDGMRLWLNDRLVISAWYDQSEQTYRRDFFWHGGAVDVRVEHYENGGDARARLMWERIE